MKKLPVSIAVGALLATTLIATPATAAPAGQGFTVTPADLAYILKQIKIAEAHAAATTSETGPCGALLGTGPHQLPSPLLSMGLRTVDGTCNNLVAGQEKHGAADQAFPRLAGKDFKAAENAPAGLFGPGSPAFPTTYADKKAANTVVDSQPRVISNLIVDQTAANPAAVAAAGNPVRSQTKGTTTPATDGQTLFIPNVTTDVGLSAPYNSWFTLFGQFFDHGIDQTVKGGGTVIVPLRADDPLIAGADRVPGTADDPKPGDARYVPPSMRFMALTRAANQPGADGKLGTADDVQDARNTDTPFVDLSQTYTSHAAHQVFLREYAQDPAGRTVSTGRLLSGAAGGLPTWAETKRQARELLGLALTDADVLDVPQILTDPYGKFVPGPARGLPQYVTRHGLVEGDRANPVAVPADTLHFDTPFLTDIAHNADPTPVDADHNPATAPVAPRADDDHTASADFASQPAGTYDDEMLDAHYIAGDGRANENIGLTSIHQIFHSEHERLVGDIERVLTEDGGPALAEWKLGDDWNGERIFQAARFIDEMEYQHLVFEEFARKIQPAINPFQPFAFTQSELNPAIYAEFAHAVYRFGHSMLTETIARTAEDGSDDSMSLLDGFLNPPAYTNGGTMSPEQAAGEIVMGMSDQVGNELDEFMTDTLRDNLLGLPMDLAAVNIARGRSEGVPSLNTMRRSLYERTNDGRLAPYRSWVDFGENLKHPESLVNFVAAYGKHPSIRTATTVKAKRDAARAIVDPQPGDVTPDDAAAFLNATGAWTTATSGLDDVDLWVGGLAETTQPFGGLLGSTFDYVFETQLTALQNGDRLYYLARTPGMNLRTQLEGNSFAELIMRNTTAHTLRADVFSTSDCKFQLGNLAGTPAGYAALGNRVADDPGTDCDEQALLIRMPDGTIKYRARNSVDPSGINGQSVYNGTEDRDRVVAGNDNDTVWGNEGDDVLEGGAGNDVTLGGEGDDVITDLSGDDMPKGGPGNDAIEAGPGLDIVNGGTGKDFTNGGANANDTFAGEGDDFLIAGDGEDAAWGDSGDDWEEGGNSPDLLQGDSGSLFFLDDTNKPGHDVLIGQGGDDDYDMEGGDDIGVQGPGIEKNAGGSGYDWSIASSPEQGGDDQPMNSDLNLSLIPLDILTVGVRDRYNELEALSGGAHDDVLRGDDVIPSQVGGGGFLGCDALDAAGIARIVGLDRIVTSLPTPASAVANQTGRPCDLHGNVWGEGNILLGGAGNDTIEGRGGNDIIDGDRYLSVRLSVRDADGKEIRSARSMAELQADVFAGKINPGNIFLVREILTAPSGQDTAVFSRTSDQYAIQPFGDALVVSGPDGTDTLRNIEKLAFADKTVEVTAPVAFAGISAFAGDAQATVVWTLPADTAGDAVTGFTLERTDGTTTVLTDVPATARSLVVDGLTNGVPVTFRIRANTAAGPGEFTAASQPVTPLAATAQGPEGEGPEQETPDAGETPANPAPVVTTPTTPADPAPVVTTPTTDPRPVHPIAPDAPAIGTATAGNGTAVVHWTAPAFDGGTPVYGYEVQALEDETGTVLGVDVAGPDATELTFTDLTNGAAYAFRVRAVNAAGASGFSAVSNRVVPGIGTGTGTPGAGTPGAGTPGAGTPGAGTPGAGTPGAGTPGAGTPGTGTPGTGTPGTGTPGTGIPGTGTGTGTRTAPGSPAIGKVIAGKGLAIVRWTAPADNGGSPVVRYEVQVLTASGARVGGMRTAPATASVLAVTGLANGTAYRFRVRAVNEIGAGALSRASATVTPRTVPGGLKSLSGTSGAAGGAVTATLKWTAPTATGGSPVTAYRIVRQRLNADGSPRGAEIVTTVSGKARSFTFAGAANSRYRCTVQAVNAAGAGTGRTVTAKTR
ncbi:peroxidase family protein [Actinoplanes sp. NPDC049548]|uniref:peroxidase family protein n=1 Tax=Actinoplanes sp. NPDC049548 TaxID=3155152 RepID=UPI00341A188C